MANNLQPWRPSTGSSLQQMIAKSKEAIALATSPQEALKAAKRLVGQWPHAKPADPDAYAASLGAVLAQYPLGVVTECTDPRIGLAREREFPPTVACVVEWCDRRVALHRGVISNPQIPQIAAPEYTDDELRRGRDAMAGLWKAIGAKTDLGKLSFDQAVELGSEKPA